MSESVIIPKKIGPYLIKDTLGMGAFAVVKIAIHEESEKIFACKIVPKFRIKGSFGEDRFQNEIVVFKQLQHPNVVVLHDLLKDINNYYLMMEYCPNGELFQYIVSNNKLDEEEAKRCFKQILSGVMYIHDMHIAHRDLKPENILIGDNNDMKITDFGLSHFVQEDCLLKTACGSPCYASPECISGERYDGYKSDMWSLGVILFAMVSGTLPWTKRNQKQLFDQIKNAQYKVPPYLTPNCVNLIKSLMNPDPSDRLDAKSAMEHPWLVDVVIPMPSNTTNIISISTKKVDKLFCSESSENITLEDERFDCVTARIDDFNKIENIIYKRRVNTSVESLPSLYSPQVNIAPVKSESKTIVTNKKLIIEAKRRKSSYTVKHKRPRVIGGPRNLC